MSKKYQNLLSPMKVGNVIFKNRLMAASSKPHYIQGPEPYPTEGLITHYANKARNGAALVTVGGSGFDPLPVLAIHDGYEWYRVASGEGEPPPLPVNYQESYLSQLTEAVHFYGSKISININHAQGVDSYVRQASLDAGSKVPIQYDVSPGIHVMPLIGEKTVSTEYEGIPAELLDGVADGMALEAALMKALGFDMVFLHMSYRGSLLGRFLSPLTNRRTDRYGGSLENMARFPIMVADRIKQKCGPDFLIEGAISGTEPEGGYSLEDAIEYAKLFTGHFDLLQIRSGTGDESHPSGFIQERTPLLYMAEAVKKSGADIPIVTVGGYQDLDVCEEVIASGKADFIAMARSWISDPEYGRKAYEGRGEDVVPCIRCSKCHHPTHQDPLASVCSVNPTWGFEHKIERMITPPTDRKKVAVVGGGPAGMEAALVAAGRGHDVTLYEKSASLGGLLKTADNVSFKWPLKDFKDYLVRQIGKSDVEVFLNTEATPAMLKREGYDVVLAAVGSEPVMPDISGVDGANVMFAQEVYGNEGALAEKVVIVGGGEVGVETGMHLAEKGHQVTVLEVLDMLAPDAVPVHYYSMFKEAWEKLGKFHYILQAHCTDISPDKVTYVDADGVEHDIEAGSVVIATGMKPKNDLALEFYGTGDRFFVIGDCNAVGNVQKVMRSAFSTASML